MGNAQNTKEMTIISHFAKLSPSSNSSRAEMAIFPINPATHPDKYQNKSKQVVGRQNQVER